MSEIVAISAQRKRAPNRLQRTAPEYLASLGLIDRPGLCALLGVTDQCVIRWEHEGWLKPIPKGRERFYRRADIDAYFRGEKVPPRRKAKFKFLKQT